MCNDIIYEVGNYEDYLKQKEAYEKTWMHDSLPYYEKVCNEIETWLQRVPFTEFCTEIESRVLGQPELRVFLANVFSYLLAIVNQKPLNHNAIICAPSGCGKTETYRALKDYFHRYIPALEVYIFDISQMTATGFRGIDAADLVSRFTKHAEEEVHNIKAVGLVFMDEFDKEVEPRYTVHGENISRQEQGNLLTVIEGSSMLFSNSKKNVYVDTNYTMFVGLGSFSALRDQGKEKTYPIGMGVEKEWEACENEKNEYRMLKREDFLEAGASAELVGRFPLICNYVELSEEIVRKVILKTCENIKESMLLNELTLSEDMMQILLDSANTEFGCRMFDAKIRTLVMKGYTEALVEPGHVREILKIHVNSPEDICFKWEKEANSER